MTTRSCLAAVALLLFLCRPGVAQEEPIAFPCVKGKSYSCQAGLWKMVAEKAKGGMKESATFTDWHIAVLDSTDAVAVGKYLLPMAALSVEKTDILVPSSQRADTYGPVAKDTRTAMVEMKTAFLSANPYTVKTMRVQAEAVIAKARAPKTFPAIVMEDFKPLVEGLDVRITRLTMSKDRKLTMHVAYQRPETGPSLPFVDEVYAYDVNDVEIGGGRWYKGNPFGRTGEITFEFDLQGDQVHKTFKLVAVTESAVETVEFDVNGVFQK